MEPIPLSLSFFHMKLSLCLNFVCFRYGNIVDSWDKVWEKEKRKNKKISLTKLLLKTFGPAYSVSSVLQLIYTFMQLATPQIVNLLITFISSDSPSWQGYLYCVLVLCVAVINTVLYGQFCYIQDEVGLRLQTAITAAIYRKSFRLSSLSKQDMTGEGS